MLTISQMIDANNREVRARRRWASFDRLLMRLVFGSAILGLTIVILTLLTTPLGPLQ